jgi:hypothetical protein
MHAKVRQLQKDRQGIERSLAILFFFPRSPEKK